MKGAHSAVTYKDAAGAHADVRQDGAVRVGGVRDDDVRQPDLLKVRHEQMLQVRAADGRGRRERRAVVDPANVVGRRERVQLQRGCRVEQFKKEIDEQSGKGVCREWEGRATGVGVDGEGRRAWVGGWRRECRQSEQRHRPTEASRRLGLPAPCLSRPNLPPASPRPCQLAFLGPACPLPLLGPSAFFHLPATLFAASCWMAVRPT